MRWLKDIPSHWEEKRMKFISKMYKGNGITKLDIIENGDTPCVRYGEIYMYEPGDWSLSHMAAEDDL